MLTVLVDRLLLTRIQKFCPENNSEPVHVFERLFVTSYVSPFPVFMRDVVLARCDEL